MNSLSRRKFVQYATIPTATALLAPGCIVSESKTKEETRLNKPLNLGIMTYNFAKSWDIETIINNCSETGFKCAELRTTHSHGVEVSLSPGERSEVKKRFKDSPIETLMLASVFKYHSPEPSELEANIEGTKEYILLAKDVGAASIRIFPNSLPQDIPVEQTKQQIATAIKELALFGYNHGVQIRLSVHGYGTNSAPVIKDILDYAQSEHIYINWNCNKNDDDGKGLAYNFGLFKDRIRSVHIHELIDNSYPYELLFKLLKESGFNGYCNMEVVDESEDPIRFMKYYKALFLSMQTGL